MNLSWWLLKFSRNVKEYNILSIFGVTIVLYFTNVRQDKSEVALLFLRQVSKIF